MIDASLAAARRSSVRSQNWRGVAAVATCLIALLMVSFVIGQKSDDSFTSRKEPKHQSEDVNQSDEPQKLTDEDTGTFEKHGEFMSFSVDPLATLFAMAALSLGYVAFRASSKVWLRLVEVKSSYSTSVYENNWKGFHDLNVTIRNLGISLHDVRVCLWFRDGDGSYQHEMQQVRYDKQHETISEKSEFKQGMVGAFALKSYHFNDRTLNMIAKLDCAKKRDARLKIYSQGFLVHEFRLWQRLYWLRSRWNHFAGRINWKYKKTVVLPDGKETVGERHLLPTFNTDSQFRLECFVKGVVEDAARRVTPTSEEPPNDAINEGPFK